MKVGVNLRFLRLSVVIKIYTLKVVSQDVQGQQPHGGKGEV